MASASKEDRSSLVKNIGEVQDIGGGLRAFQNYVPYSLVRLDSYNFHPLQINFVGNQGYSYPIECLQQPSSNWQFPNYSKEKSLQDFQYFVVIDFEATCDKERIPHPQEIIEFPSVIVNSITGQLEACFQTYVRPTYFQHLTEFCKDLTGIQQIQVDRGVTLSEALLKHDKWLESKGIKNTNFAVVTWSDWDCRVMLESECRFKKIRKPSYFNRWINLKVPFQEAFAGARCNLKKAVEMAGLTWEGRAHCGLDDAKNTARLLSLLLRRGVRLTITNSLTNYPSEASSEQQKEHELPVIYYHPLCFCGLRSVKGLVQRPGMKFGSFFYGCGNSMTAARCHFFQWASAAGN